MSERITEADLVALVFAPTFKWAVYEMTASGAESRRWRFVRDVADVRGYPPATKLLVFGRHALSEAQHVALEVAVARRAGCGG